jgi:serine/threonine-protein kinase
MAPEQVKGLDVDHRADVYALGVLLFRCITGQYPFHGPNSAATMIAHLNQPVPTFFSVAPEAVVPEGLEEVVRRCLAKSPSDRYASMGELMDELATCMEMPPDPFRSVSMSHSTIQREVGPGSSTRRGRGGLFLAAAVVALVLLAVLGIAAVVLWWLVFAGAPTPTPAVEVPDTPVVEPVAVEVEEVPEPDLDPDLDPEAEAEAEAVPEPAPPPARVAPAAPVTSRVQPAPAPEPEPEPEPEEDEEEAPEGYMGLPDDLFGE